MIFPCRRNLIQQKLWIVVDRWKLPQFHSFSSLHKAHNTNMASSANEVLVLSLSFNGLRKECTKHGLAASGNASVLRKRLRCFFGKAKPDPEGRNDTSSSKRSCTSSEEQKSSKRQKRSIVDDLLCPITLELPVDPVTAEDGRYVTERSAPRLYLSIAYKL